MGKIGFRGYKDPLEYYKANLDKYKGLSRWELSKKDSYLHRSLLKKRLLDKLIPCVRTNLSKKEIKRAVKVYRSCKNVLETSRRLKRCPEAIRKCCNKKGIITKNKRDLKDPLEYYKANLDKYKGLSRGELSKKDSYLCQGFWRKPHTLVCG
ncbi:hypothetical protein BMS3Abin17_01266 [archaeon BMS3Abin17]|nr:hypothetical protein BMS3Abin17_01266 [archaeon BMS3Abin17]HDZ60602.1 hypothetical protein [Candidatus Pacearchaeota archaeon]